MSEGVRSVEGMEAQNKVSTLGPLPVLDPSAPTTSTVPTIVVPPTVALLSEQASVLAAHVDYLARAVSIVRAEPSELDHVGAAFEHLARTIGVAQVRLVARMEVAIEDLKNSMSFGPKRSKYRSTQDRLSQVLHINTADVTARLTVAHATFTAPETLMTDLNTDVPLPDRPGEAEESGQEVPHPVVGAAFHAGQIAVPVSSKIIHAVDRLRPIIHQLSETQESAKRLGREVETALVAAAKTLTPKDVDKAIKDWEHELNAKGVLPTQEARREFQGAFYKGKKMGLFEWTIRLDELQQESLLTAIAPEVNPRTKDHDPSMPLLDVDGREVPTVLDEHGKVVEPPKDDRNYGQKRLDGLIHAINVALTTGKVSRHGGYQPQIMVNIDHKTLERDLTALATGMANGSAAEDGLSVNSFGLNPAFRSDAVHSGPINPIMIRRLACNAELLPIVLGSDSQILDAGNRARLFSAEQRKLMYARDRGCTFPNCKQGVDRCEAHHVHEYSRGGETTLENGAMVCSHHHHLVHETEWRIQVKNGVPYWVAPLDEDPNQRLLRNVYFHPEKIGQLPIAA